MVEFIYKFEPIYIQRSITQALTYIFPDSTTQWRLNWYNEVKMPILTTILLFEQELSLKTNMDKFKAMIKLDQEAKELKKKAKELEAAGDKEGAQKVLNQAQENKLIIKRISSTEMGVTSAQLQKVCQY